MSHGNQIVCTSPLRYDDNYVIRHTTVCQILKADRIHSTAPFTFEGSELRQIILLGNLSLHKNAAHSTDFNLDDGTGSVIVRVWNNDSMNVDMIQFRLETYPYARVIGEVNNWQNSNLVKATKIEFTLSPYELYHHILQAIHDTVACEKDHPESQQIMRILECKESTLSDITELLDSTPSSQSTSTQTLNKWASKRSNNACILHGKEKARLDDSPLHSKCLKSKGNFCPSQHVEARGLGMSYAQFSPCVHPQLQYFDRHKLYSRLPSLDREILNAICKESKAGNQDLWKGVHLSKIIEAVSYSCTNSFTKEEFTESLERLFTEGFIFSSIDDYHYDVTFSSSCD